MTRGPVYPLQQQLGRLAKTLMVIISLITALLFPIGIWQGVGWLEMFETAVAVAVAAIPEGLVVSMTVILAVGMQRIFKRKALVRKLVAAETLGSVSVICCDKTGTLTEGKMKVVEHQGRRDLIIRAALLANDERDEESLAMRDWAESEIKSKTPIWTQHSNLSEIKAEYPRLTSIPFSSSYKYTASVNQGRRSTYLSVAGAPEVVMSRSDISQQQQRNIQRQIDVLAEQGYRLIAFAGQVLDESPKKLKPFDLKKLEWYGLLAFADPLRPQVRKSLSQARKAGVAVKVITGDYLQTAVSVLQPVLGNLSEAEIMTGAELAELTETELRERIEKTVLFARTTPNQKLRLVKALVESGQVVAMTGDGVNDAPALKAADIGVVVNEATDVSKQTADMVLLNSDFKTIIAAIKEGRGIYDSIKKVVAYLLSDTFQELILIGGSLILGLPLPVTAIQILWINLVEDSFLGISLAFEKSENDVMLEPPRPRNKFILDKEVVSIVATVGLVSNMVLLTLYAVLLSTNTELIKLQTFMFAAMATNSLIYIFSIKSLRKNIWQESPFNNPYLIAAVLLGFALTAAAVYLPVLQLLLGTVSLAWTDWLILLGLGLTTTTLVELIKWLFNRRNQL